MIHETHAALIASVTIPEENDEVLPNAGLPAAFNLAQAELHGLVRAPPRRPHASAGQWLGIAPFVLHRACPGSGKTSCQRASRWAFKSSKAELTKLALGSATLTACRVFNKAFCMV